MIFGIVENSGIQITAKRRRFADKKIISKSLRACKYVVIICNCITCCGMFEYNNLKVAILNLKPNLFAKRQILYRYFPSTSLDLI